MYNKKNTGIIIPSICPVCNTKLTKTDVRLFCPNDNCEGRAYKRIEKWIKKLKVKGFGPALLKFLFNEGFVRKVSDFYKVDLKEVLDSTNLKKATKKAFDNLLEVKEIPLSTFIGGLDIEGVGERVIQFAVDAGHTSMLDFEFATQKLMGVNGIGPDRAEKIEKGIEYMHSEIISILEHIKIEEPKKEKVMDGVLKGKVFCFTGKLETMKRDDAFDLTLNGGGKVSKSINGTTTHLVTNSSTDDPKSATSKMKKAKELGINIITEKDFLQMIKE